jgi:5-methylcytosine-specific restriction endonuclease McrA
MYHGKLVRMTSLRYQIFKRSLQCVKCTRTGMFFALEAHAQGIRKGQFHFNLYMVHRSGGESMFTKDHIVPISRGGDNTLNNLQTMCAKCNHNKGSRITIKEAVCS